MRRKREKWPERRRINLAEAAKPKRKYKIIVPVVILMVLLGLLCKAAVWDRWAALRQAQAGVQTLQEQLDNAQGKADQYSGWGASYAHYTNADMTEEELTRADRLQVLELIDSVVLPRAEVNGWTLTGNELTLPLTEATLDEINDVVRKLEDDPRVEYCVVTTAVKEEKDEDTTVTGQVTVLLKSAEAEEG